MSDNENVKNVRLGMDDHQTQVVECVCARVDACCVANTQQIKSYMKMFCFVN